MHPDRRPEPPPRWAARLEGVVEVTLRGRADLAPWAAFGTAHGQDVDATGGAASVVVTSAVGRFAGLPFTEVTIAVAVWPPEGAAPGPAVLLAEAWNSSRVLAWCERTCFGTGYVGADVAAEVEPRPGLAVHVGGAAVLAAAAVADRPWTEAEGAFDGRVYLKAKRPDGPDRPPRWFRARLEGATRRRPFARGQDVFRAAAGAGVLAASGFVPETWEVRAAAVHARTKTFAGGRAR